MKISGTFTLKRHTLCVAAVRTFDPSTSACVTLRLSHKQSPKWNSRRFENFPKTQLEARVYQEEEPSAQNRNNSVILCCSRFFHRFLKSHTFKWLWNLPRPQARSDREKSQCSSRVRVTKESEVDQHIWRDFWKISSSLPKKESSALVEALKKSINQPTSQEKKMDRL